MKYITVEINGIVTQIAKPTEFNGFTEGVLEAFLPDDETLEVWTENQAAEWTLNNNKRMEAICKFLNENNL